MESGTLKILNLHAELRDEFFSAARLPEGISVEEFDTIPKIVKSIKGEGEAPFNVLIFLPKRSFDPRKARRIRLASLDAPLYVVGRDCREKDCLTYLTLGVNAVLQPPFSKGDVQQVLNGRASEEMTFPRSPEVAREGQVRLDFLLPSKLSRILGVNRLVALLASEFGFPPEDARVNLPLVMDEALTNAIVHGNGQREDRKVHVRIYVSTHRFFVQVEDEGDGFDPEATGDPKQGENLFKHSGRGIFLMRELMDRVEWKNGGRLLELEKRNPLNGES